MAPEGRWLYSLGMERVQLFVLVLLLALLTAAACGGSSRDGLEETETPSQRGGTKELMGLVVDVKAASLVELESLTVRDEQGRLWSFITEGPLVNTPSHLRKHPVRALPVTAYYRETSKGLVAVSVSD